MFFFPDINGALYIKIWPHSFVSCSDGVKTNLAGVTVTGSDFSTGGRGGAEPGCNEDHSQPAPDQPPSPPVVPSDLRERDREDEARRPGPSQALFSVHWPSAASLFELQPPPRCHCCSWRFSCVGVLTLERWQAREQQERRDKDEEVQKAL